MNCEGRQPARLCRYREKTHSHVGSRVHHFHCVSQGQSMRKSQTMSPHKVTLSYLSSWIDQFVRCAGCQWEHRPGAIRCETCNTLIPNIAHNWKEKIQAARLHNNEAFVSLKHFVKIQRPRDRKGGSSPEGQLTVTARQDVKRCPQFAVLRMRRSLAQGREVPHRHAGARQHDRRTCNSGTNLQRLQHNTNC